MELGNSKLSASSDSYVGADYHPDGFAPAQGHASIQNETAESIQTWLTAKLAEYLEVKAADIDIHKPFASYGLESVDAVGLSGDIEEWLGRELAPTLLYDYPSIANLTRYLVAGCDAHGATKEGERRQEVTAEPIAIIGMSCHFPGGANTPEAFWQLLKSGKDAISEIPAERWEIDSFYDPDPDAPGKMYTRHGGFLENISGFDAQFFGISPREAVRMDPQQRLLVEAAWEALEDAGQAADKLAGSQTGVFIGMMNNSEYAQLQVKTGDSTYVDDPYFGIGSSSSIASGRLSYLFDLRGPTMTVDTACSSSLVSVHLACQSLRNKECKLALAGGVNAITLPESVVNACKMRMLAADGRCKTFDAVADGFVLGEGCGMVVLKRLSEAIADGDSILAIIRGTAVNQDGRSNGITAPNKLAQQAVIRKALANAGVEPHRVSYVETHGSGTSLGDPIEVEALVAALGEGRSPDQRIMMGAVKTNIGHLAGAAGIAGLIKTVLALQHKEIPAHLNLKELNPHVCWERMPVMIPTRPVPWSTKSGSRVAGVSSFGWSGTNAHIVLEEAPAVEASETCRPYHVLTLSAKTESALERMTDNLVVHLKQHSHENLADIAYTCQVGRSALSHRRVLVCHDLADALTALETRDAQRILTGTHRTEHRPITFLFSGLGDHYVKMAWQLYELERVFREHIDRCSDLLKPHLGLDPRDVLYPNRNAKGARDGEDAQKQSNDGGGHSEGSNGRDKNGRGKSRHATSPVAQGIDLRQLLKRDDGEAGEAAQKLNQTVLAQPVLFMIEYALAQLWLSWGVRPQAMIGYSLGEYVAACMAGVMSLEDALALVAKRAQMIQELPAGAMLAVALSEQDVRPLLNQQLSLAAVNGSSVCVIAGPVDAVNDLEHLLSGNGVACRCLQTSHAFHSSMMEPIEASFAALVKTIKLNPPQVPYVSNVTGTWITARQAMDPQYWVKHLRQTVRFADGIREVSQKPNGILLEVGPGQSLGSLALQHPANNGLTDLVVLPTLRYAYDPRPDMAFLLRTLGQLWLAGVRVDWKGYYANERRHRLSLPTYPFERQHYWVEVKKQTNRPQSSGGKKKLDLTDWFYTPIWKQSRPFLASELRDLREQKQCWLVFADACCIGNQLAAHLEQLGQDVTTVIVGDAFRRVRDGIYTINPQARDDYDALLKHLHLVNKAPQYIIHLWSVTPVGASHGRKGSVPILETEQYLSFYSLLFLAQALGTHRLGTPLQMLVLSNNMHEVIGGEGLCPGKATVLGPCKVIPKEYLNITCRSIDVVLPEAGTRQSERLVEQLVTECSASTTESVIAYRGDYRWVRSFESVPLGDTSKGIAPLRAKGVYLITGGLGGIGLALAEYLAQAAQARLVLIGRSVLPLREQWTQWLADHDADDPVSRKIRKIWAIEELGAEVLIVKADVSNQDDMRRVIARTHAQFGKMHGVIHAAGVPGEGLMQLKTPETVERVFAPKIQGTLVLEAILKDEQLDFIAFYSSSNAITGGLGEVDYCAANAFLDAFAFYARSQRTLPAVSINWGPWQWDAWQGTLFASLPELAAKIKQVRETYGVTFREGTEAFQRVLSSSLAQILVLPQGLQATIEQSMALSSLSFLENIDEARPAKPVYARPNLRNIYVAPRTEAEQKIADIWQEALGIERVGINDHFFELGGNSLVGMLIISRLQKEFKIQLSAASLFEGPTISSLLELIRPNQRGRSDLEQNNARGKLRRERLRKQKPNVQTVEEEC